MSDLKDVISFKTTTEDVTTTPVGSLSLKEMRAHGKGELADHTLFTVARLAAIFKTVRLKNYIAYCMICLLPLFNFVQDVLVSLY